MLIALLKGFSLLAIFVVVGVLEHKKDKFKDGVSRAFEWSTFGLALTFAWIVSSPDRNASAYASTGMLLLFQNNLLQAKYNNAIQGGNKISKSKFVLRCVLLLAVLVLGYRLDH
jgi:hypothetical protein